MTRKLLSLLLALVLTIGSTGAIHAQEYRSPEQIAREAAEKTAAMQAEAEAEIAARNRANGITEGYENESDNATSSGSASASTKDEEGATPKSNAEVDAYCVSLEQKYGITILYDTDNDGGACIGTGALSALDSALFNLTPAFVRQVSTYWWKQTGKRLRYSFVYSPYQRMNLGVDVLGSFDVETATIEIYLPSYAGNVIMGGESPLTYIHEFGHAFQHMLMDLHGEAALQREWTRLNGESSYSFGDYPSAFDETVWISAYASTRYEEDFAEVFAHAFLRNRAGLGFAGRLTTSTGAYTVLGKKVAYMEKMLTAYAHNADAVVASFRRLHSAAKVLNYNGYQFSGDYLQFSGYVYPRYVLRSLLGYMNVTAKTSAWITEIGGWEITTNDGQVLVVFPGGTWFTADTSIARAS